MSTITLLLALSTLGAAPEGVGSHHFPLLTTAAVERLPLPSGGAPYTLTVDRLSAQLSLRPARPLKSLGRSLQGTLCQATGEEAGSWRLHCKSDQLDARLTSGGTELTVMLLRGLPWQPGDDGPPRVFYSPEAGAREDPCPGWESASRGECAFSKGRFGEAAALFQKALAGPYSDFAALRLGDLDLLGNDPEAAVGHYTRAGSAGPFGHLSTERLAELTGDGEALAFLAGLEVPTPVREELELRLARWRAYRGDPGRAAQDLLGGSDLSACRRDPRLCRRLLLGALRESKGDPYKAVALYLRLPERQQGPLCVELAEAAAESVAALGAPRFGANLRAALYPQVPAERRRDYLQRTAELFLLAGDGARAEVICDFARTRADKLGVCAASERQVSGSGRRRGSGRSPRPRSLEGEIDADVAAAAKAIANTHAAKSEPANPKPSKPIAALPAPSKP